MQAGTQIFKQRVWDAIVAGSVTALEAVIWEIITAEVHSRRCSFRKAVLFALDGSDFASEAHRNELLQRFAAQSGAGDTDAQCFIGILLCFQGGHEGTEFVMPAHGVKFLHAAAERHNNLATLLLALCFECGKGVEVSKDAAKQCYSMASTRGYQVAQIFLKELVRDASVAQQQQQLQQMQSSLQAANLGGLGNLGGYGAAQPPLPGAAHPGLQPPQNILPQYQYNSPQQVGHLTAQDAAQKPVQPNSFTSSSQQGQVQALIEQQMNVAKKRLQDAVQDRDLVGLAAAIDWAQAVCSATGRQMQELRDAISILNFCRENNQKFPELPGSGQEAAQPASPAPSHRSATQIAGGQDLNISPKSQANERPSPAKPEPGEQEAEQPNPISRKVSSDTAQQPTAAERGEAFFEGTQELGIPMEPLEHDVDRTPSEQPLPGEAQLEELGADTAPAAAKPQPAALAKGQKESSPAVKIPRRGTSSHGSIGDRRTLNGNGHGGGAGSVAESEPPLTREALHLFNLASNAGSRSAPSSHLDVFERLSVASLSSLQAPAAEPAAPDGPEAEKLEAAKKAAPHAGQRPPSRAASTRPPSPAAFVQEEPVQRAQSTLGVRLDQEGKAGEPPPVGFGAEGSPVDIDRLVSQEDLRVLAQKGVSIEARRTAFSSTTDPEKLEAYARGIRQLLEPGNGRQQGQEALTAPVDSPFKAVADQDLPAQSTAATAALQSSNGQLPGEDWGKLMQVLHGSTTGLEGEPLSDYLHNLRMLCNEDPANDMVMPPTQSIPGIDAVLGALQAQGTPPQQQQELLQLAARSQLQGQARPQLRPNLQALGQQRFSQNLGAQGVPLHLQGLQSNDLANRLSGGMSQSALGAGHNQLAYHQAMNPLAARQMNQNMHAAGAPYVQPNAHDMSQLLASQGLGSRQLNGFVQPQGNLGLPTQPMMPQVRAQNGVPANYDQLWGVYGNKLGALGAAGNPNLLGGANTNYKGSANRFVPGLPAKPLPADLHRSMLTQNSLSGSNLALGGMSDLNASMAAGGLGSNAWNPALLSQASRVGAQGLGNQLLGSQGLHNYAPGSLDAASLQSLQNNARLPEAQQGAASAGQQQPGLGLQGLRAAGGPQGLRLGLSQPLQAPQPIGPPAASQASRADQGPAPHMLMHASGSLPPEQEPPGQGRPENPWGPLTMQQGSGGGLAPSSAGLERGRSSDPGSASMGILSKDAEMQARLKQPWGSSGAMTAPGLPLGASEPASALAGWNSSSNQALRLPFMNKARAGSFGSEEGLGQAFRQKPPRPAGAGFLPQQPQLPLRTAANAPGMLGQFPGLMNLGPSLAGDAGGLTASGSGGLGHQGSANLGQNLGPNGDAPGGGGGGGGGSGGLGGAPLSSLLSNPRQNRFPGLS